MLAYTTIELGFPECARPINGRASGWTEITTQSYPVRTNSSGNDTCVKTEFIAEIMGISVLLVFALHDFTKGHPTTLQLAFCVIGVLPLGVGWNDKIKTF